MLDCAQLNPTNLYIFPLTIIIDLAISDISADVHVREDQALARVDRRADQVTNESTAAGHVTIILVADWLTTDQAQPRAARPQQLHQHRHLHSQGEQQYSLHPLY